MPRPISRIMPAPMVKPRRVLKPRANGSDLAVDLTESHGHSPVTTCPHCGEGTASTPLTEVVYSWQRCVCGTPSYPHLRPVIWHDSCHVGTAPLKGWPEVQELMRFVHRSIPGKPPIRSEMVRPKQALEALIRRYNQETGEAWNPPT